MPASVSASRRTSTATMDRPLPNKMAIADRSIVLSVAMPAYNEEASIKKVILDHVELLESLGGQVADWEIVCLDDASTDRTAEILAELAASIPRLRILRHAKNKGIFESMAAVTRAARGTHVYLTASDGQWPAENLLPLLRAVTESHADLAIWVRQNRSEVYGLKRRIVSYFFNLLPRLLFGVKTMDAGSAKLALREIYTFDLISHSPFAEVERILLARRAGYRIARVLAAFKARPGGNETGANLKNVLASLRDCFRCIRRYGLRSRTPFEAPAKPHRLKTKETS